MVRNWLEGNVARKLVGYFCAQRLVLFVANDLAIEEWLERARPLSVRNAALLTWQASK